MAGIAWPWRGRLYDPLKCQELPSWHNVTSQKIVLFSSTAAWTPNLTQKSTSLQTILCTTYNYTVTQQQCCWQPLQTLTWKDLLTVELNTVSAEANIISVPTNNNCWVQGTVHSWADIFCGCRGRASAMCWGAIVTQASDRIKELTHSTSQQICPSILHDRQGKKVWVSLTSRLTI